MWRGPMVGTHMPGEVPWRGPMEGSRRGTVKGGRAVAVAGGGRTGRSVFDLSVSARPPAPLEPPRPPHKKQKQKPWEAFF